MLKIWSLQNICFWFQQMFKLLWTERMYQYDYKKFSFIFRLCFRLIFWSQLLNNSNSLKSWQQKVFFFLFLPYLFYRDYAELCVKRDEEKVLMTTVRYSANIVLTSQSGSGIIPSCQVAFICTEAFSSVPSIHFCRRTRFRDNKEECRAVRVSSSNHGAQSVTTISNVFVPTQTHALQTVNFETTVESKRRGEWDHQWMGGNSFCGFRSLQLHLQRPHQ